MGPPHAPPQIHFRLVGVAVVYRTVKVQSSTVVMPLLNLVQEMHGAYVINPLPTDDAFWHRRILATCYQLAQP